MNTRKLCYLIVLSFGKLVHSSDNNYVIDFINDTNLPVSIKQNDREITLCRAFEAKKK